MPQPDDAILAELAAHAKGYGDEPLRLSFEDAWRRWQKSIGMARQRYKGPAKARKPRDRTRYVVLPDLHAPFHEEAMFADFIARESQRADECVCIGDLGDAYALSRFLQYESVPYRDEWAQVTLVIQVLSESFPKVRVILGNHDMRLEKQLRAHVTRDMVDAIECLTGGVLDPIRAIAKRFPNVEVVSHATKSGHLVWWFTTIGDAILLHAEKYSKVPGSVLRSIDDWIDDNRLHMQIPDVKLVLQGHTHQMAMIPWRADRLLVEVGCLCQTQGYMTGPRIGGRPQKRGYVWFEQRDGVTDLNSVGMHCYDFDTRFTSG